jgi:hypothetical protein
MHDASGASVAPADESTSAAVYHNGTSAQMRDANAESRFHLKVGESEASLLGVVYTEEGVMTAAPYAVVEPDHWVFEGTGLTAAGDVFGESSFNERIPGGASGHETDKRSPSSPRELRALSASNQWKTATDPACVCVRACVLSALLLRCTLCERSGC